MTGDSSFFIILLAMSNPVSGGFTPTISAPTIITQNDYFAFGLRHENPSYAQSTTNRYLFNGKEFQSTGAVDLLDYGARTYDPRTARFTEIDRFAEKYFNHSPYSYVAGNPVKHIDINGDSVSISGASQAAALSQIQSRVSSELNITQNPNGTLSATRISNEGVLSGEAQQVYDAIGSVDARVNLVAEDSNMTSTGNLYIGGAMMGNNVDGSTAVATQEVNPGVLGAMSDAYGNPGNDMVHELTEGYQGALISIEAGVSSPMAGQTGSVYNQAHDAAVPQSGTLRQVMYDSNGRVTTNVRQAVNIEYVTNDGTVIETYP